MRRAAPCCALALLALSTCISRDVRPAPGPTRATVFVTAGLRGTIAPCGCSENMLGGVSRIAGLLSAARDPGAHVFLVDAGDLLFGASHFNDDAAPQQERKAQALADAFRAMGVAAHVPGALDDARGPAFRTSLGLPELPVGETRRLDAGGRQLAVVAAADVARAQAEATRARRAGAAFVLALVEQPFEVVSRGAPGAPAVDVLVAARPASELDTEVDRVAGEAPKVVQLRSRGRSVLRVDVSLRDDGRVRWLEGDAERQRQLSTLDERIELSRDRVRTPGLDAKLKALEQSRLDALVERRRALAEAPVDAPGDGSSATLRAVPVEASLPKDAAVAAIERAYDAAVGELNVAWAKAHGRDCDAPTPERPGVVGTDACAACHPAAARAWSATGHARAYRALAAEGKQHHLDCLGCHVTGWQQPGGVCRVDRTAGREAVGCEACHGPGSTHAAAPSRANVLAKPAATTCVACHDAENSPAFDFARYRAQLIAPGHGLPPGEQAP